MKVTDQDVLDAFDSFEEESVTNTLLQAKLSDDGFDLANIIDAIYKLTNRGLLIVNITGDVQRAQLEMAEAEA